MPPHDVFKGVVLLKSDNIYEKASIKYFLILRMLIIGFLMSVCKSSNT